jgi:transmembrane sensor
MVKNFQNVEEVIVDEAFQGWFFRHSDKQVAAWQNWLAENPGQLPLVQQAIEFMTELKINEQGISPVQIKEAYTRLNTRLDKLENEAVPVVQLAPRRKRWWLSAAAAVLLIIAGAAFWNWEFSNRRTSIESPYGQISKHQLPDGSEVMLNANSTITLSQGWDEGKDREVWLKGEAFFEITKTPNKSKFTVHTDQGDIIVTGTQFNAINRDNKTSVLLTEGSVTLKAKEGNEIVMKPGDFVEMLDNQLKPKKANEEAVIAWKQNKLVFEKTPVKEAVKIISDHYGVKISLAGDSIEEKTVNGILPNNNLDDLLKALEATTGFVITRKNKEIIISVISKP